MSINNNSRFCSLCIKKFHPQIPLEECKHKQQQQKNYIDDELKSDSDNDE